MNTQRFETFVPFSKALTSKRSRDSKRYKGTWKLDRKRKDFERQ